MKANPLTKFPALSNEGTTFAVVSSGMANVYVDSLALPVHTIPAFKVNVGVSTVVVTSNDICASDAVLERGTYPIFPARETTFSRRVKQNPKRIHSQSCLS